MAPLGRWLSCIPWNERPPDTRDRNVQGISDTPQGHAIGAKVFHGIGIHRSPWPPDMFAHRSGVGHAGAHPLGNQVPLELRYRTDNVK
jgi:hypothetical protein